MWNKKSRRDKDPNAKSLEHIVDGDDDADSILQLQESLIQQTQHYLSLIQRHEISDMDLPALEAICFLAVVEDQIGLDDELLGNCVTLLGVSRNQYLTTIQVLERIYGIAAGDLFEFILAFTQNLQNLQISGGFEKIEN